MADRQPIFPFTFFKRIRDMREQEEERARNNPFLAKALETEKLESHRLAVIARSVALGVIMILLPILNPHPSVLFYEAIILVFIAMGWLQLRMARVGYSAIELRLIFMDLLLMTIVCVVPNPFLFQEVPNAVVYRFDNFIYFFLLLATATLAYSWRTIWGMATWVLILWMSAAGLTAYFGFKIPELTTSVAQAVGNDALLMEMLDPNSVQFDIRLQEVVVFFLVAAILALKGQRSNAMLMKQADIAAERANLSRYFPANLVDSLASTDHDIGAVRSQEIAVLFSDIVGFTKLAETHPPEEVMELLRRHHALVENAIFRNHGTLDKYLGDGVMATFGTPLTTPDDAANAFSAAQQIIDDTKAFNAENKRTGEPEIRISVGLHFGPAIIGDIGPARRMEFAVLGDTVNVASRLEAASRDFDCQCVVSDDLMKKVNGKAKALGIDPSTYQVRKAVHLKGRTAPIDVWTA